MDFLAGILELIGMYLIGNKSRWGFITTLAGCILWIAYVITSNHSYGLLTVVIPAIVINIINFKKWSIR